MNIEAKKNNLIQMILSIADENILDQVKTKIIDSIASKNVEGKTEHVIDKYKTQIAEKLDLELLKKEQNYKSPSLEEVEKLIEEADIQEPIEELLKMI